MPGGRKETVSDPEILQIFVEAEDPFLSTSEVADQLGFSNPGTLDRLEELFKQDYLRKKKVGNSYAWWVTETGIAFASEEN